MPKVELTISPDYVPSWTIVEAAREIFQNAIDQEAQDAENAMTWEYNRSQHQLRVCNKKSALELASLLLGSTSKAGDTNTVGQFGEGYKIATLVFLRNSKPVTFLNYGANQVWRPRFVDSRRFDSKILTFFVETKPAWTRVPDNNLTVVIDNITPEEYDNQIVPSILQLRNDYKVLHSTAIADVVDLPGKVFVNGLFVCDYEAYKLGYNFKPGTIKLDRDRKMADSFDLRWTASRVWSLLDVPQRKELIAEGASDVEYISHVSYDTTLFKDVYSGFKAQYGENAVPVVSQREITAAHLAGAKPVVVNAVQLDVMRKAPDFVSIEDMLKQNKALNPIAELQALVNKYTFELEEALGDEVFDTFYTLLKLIGEKYGS